MSLERQYKRSPYFSGDARPARVLRLYVTDDGVPVVDVVDTYGNVFRACRFAGDGGGAGAFVYFPPTAPGRVSAVTPEGTESSEVLLSFPDGALPHPWVTGTLSGEGVRRRVSDKLPTSTKTQDYPLPGDDQGKTGLRDYGIEQAGARLLVSERGELVLDARDAKMPVRVQLAAGEALRVSVDGEADERLILAGPLRVYVDALVDRVNQLGRALWALETWANTVPDGAAPGLVGYQAAVNAAGMNPLDVVSPGPDPVSGEGAFGKTSDEMVASAMRISGRSVEED